MSVLCFFGLFIFPKIPKKYKPLKMFLAIVNMFLLIFSFLVPIVFLVVSYDDYPPIFKVFIATISLIFIIPVGLLLGRMNGEFKEVN